ncbi:peptidase inhibitor family I36 protein [Streptomyces sp. NPDC057539]|uniref:peptidase inhibitor family I36 protein n=1 Tax=Streptomyces sp. NPDC057539 TaxID=3346159 RepID=UPI0036CEF8C2
MKRIMARLAFATAGMVAAVPLLAGTAGAVAQDGNCEDLEFCVFRQIDRDWAADWKASDTYYANNDYPLHPGYTVNNSASSVWNRNPCRVVLYNGINGDTTGGWINMPSGFVDNDLREVGGIDFNNVASGHSIACP